jgi:hypothetical protein
MTLLRGGGRCRCDDDGEKTRGRGDVNDMWTSIKDAADHIILNSVTRIKMPTYPLSSYSLDVGCGNTMGVGLLPAIIDSRQAAAGEKMRMRQ